MELLVNVFQKQIAEFTPQGVVLKYVTIGTVGIISPNCIAHFFRIKNQSIIHFCRHSFR